MGLNMRLKFSPNPPKIFHVNPNANPNTPCSDSENGEMDWLWDFSRGARATGPQSPGFTNGTPWGPTDKILPYANIHVCVVCGLIRVWARHRAKVRIFRVI